MRTVARELAKISARLDSAIESVEGAIVVGSGSLYRADGLLVQLRNQLGRLRRLKTDVDKRLAGFDD